MSSPTANAWPECRGATVKTPLGLTNRTSVLRRSGKFKKAHPDRVQSDAMDGSQVRRSQMSARNGPGGEVNAPYRYPTTPAPTNLRDAGATLTRPDLMRHEAAAAVVAVDRLDHVDATIAVAADVEEALVAG